jgi:hypothetical protein
MHERLKLTWLTAFKLVCIVRAMNENIKLVLG